MPDTVRLGTAERQMALLGGKAFIEDGPLAQFIGMHNFSVAEGPSTETRGSAVLELSSSIC